jgi:hypothetical protein
MGGGVLGAVGRKENSFDKDFGEDITNALTPGKAPVIAEVLEDSEPPVNNRMAALGGSGPSIKLEYLARPPSSRCR